MECGSSDIFSRHICSTVAETIGVTNYAAGYGAKNVQKTTFKAAEMMLGPWNQQVINISQIKVTNYGKDGRRGWGKEGGYACDRREDASS